MIISNLLQCVVSSALTIFPIRQLFNNRIPVLMPIGASVIINAMMVGHSTHHSMNLLVKDELASMAPCVLKTIVDRAWSIVIMPKYLSVHRAKPIRTRPIRY